MEKKREPEIFQKEIVSPIAKQVSKRNGKLNERKGML